MQKNKQKKETKGKTSRSIGKRNDFARDRVKGQPNDIDCAIGNRLREIRMAAGYSAEDLAKDSGVSYQQIHKYETGKNRISASKLYVFAKTFNINPALFFLELNFAEKNTKILLPSLKRTFVKDSELSEIIKYISPIKDKHIRSLLLDILKTHVSAI